MALTDLQREQRRKHIGSSDAAAIMGLDPWRNAADIWAEKRGLVQASDTANEAAEIGLMIESSLLDWAAAQIGAKIRKNQRRVYTGGVLAANHDALVIGEPVGVEAKTTGILTPAMKRDEWGDEGTDQVPNRVIIQCHHQMIVSDLSRVYVPALIGGRGRLMFVIERNEALASGLAEKLMAFWREYVETGVSPPTDEFGLPSLATLKALRREPETVATLPDEIMEAWVAAKAEAKRASDAEDEARRALLTALGTAEAGESSAGRITYMPQDRRSIDTKALRAAHPEIAAQFERVTTSPTLRFKANKEAIAS